MSFYDHPAFNGISKEFLLKMDQTMKAVSKSSDTTTIMAALMAISNEAKRYNVALTPARQQALVLHLRNTLPPEKRSQFDVFVNMMKNK